MARIPLLSAADADATYLSQAPGTGLVEGATKAELEAKADQLDLADHLGTYNAHGDGLLGVVSRTDGAYLQTTSTSSGRSARSSPHRPRYSA